MIWKARRIELAKYDISVIQAAVLEAVHFLKDNASPSQISRYLFQEQQSISELLSRMEKRGWIKKVKDKNNKRKILIVPTKKGEDIYHRQTNNSVILEKIVNSLSLEEKENLQSALIKLFDAALMELALEHNKSFLYQQDTEAKELHV